MDNSKQYLFRGDTRNAVPLLRVSKGKKTGNNPGQPTQEHERGVTGRQRALSATFPTPQTAPASLRCARVTDAETGEPLELRRRHWVPPVPSVRSSSARPMGDSGAWIGNTTFIAADGTNSTKGQNPEFHLR